LAIYRTTLVLLLCVVQSYIRCSRWTFGSCYDKRNVM